MKGHNWGRIFLLEEWEGFKTFFSKVKSLIFDTSCSYKTREIWAWKREQAVSKFCVLRVLDISNTRDLIPCLHSAVQTSRSPIIADKFYLTLQRAKPQKEMQVYLALSFKQLPALIGNAEVRQFSNFSWSWLMFLVKISHPSWKKKKAKIQNTTKPSLHSCSLQSANENLHQIEKYCFVKPVQC